MIFVDVFINNHMLIRQFCYINEIMFHLYDQMQLHNNSNTDTFIEYYL